MNAHQPLSEMGQAALAVARKGWPVFPCDHRLDPPGQKRCKRPLTSNGFKDATSDPVQIETWWRQFPSAMIGVPSGSRSGFWALDPDVDEVKGHNGPAELARLEAEHGGLPKTPTSATLRGGRHLLFKWNAARPVRNKTGDLPPGIDVRGDGGYIVVAPSKREDGVAYRWEISPEECELAEPPEWLYQLIETPKKRKAGKGDRTPRGQQPEVGGSARERGCSQAVLANAAREVASAAPGARNEILNKGAFNLGRMVGEGQLDRGDVEQRLLDAAGQCGLIDDDGEQATKATIQSGLDAGIEAANEFDVDAKGRVVPSPRNIILALKELGVSISYDVFRVARRSKGSRGSAPRSTTRRSRGFGSRPRSGSGCVRKRIAFGPWSRTPRAEMHFIPCATTWTH